jgi:hypothetical protein
MLDFVIQLLATVLLLEGVWFMGNRNLLLGPLLTTISEIPWVIIGITHHTRSLIVISVVLFFAQGRIFLKWRKEGVRW